MMDEPAEPEYVVVSAYPAVSSDRRDVRLELRRGPSGEPVGVAFTTVTKLVEQLGRFQPATLVEANEHSRL